MLLTTTDNIAGKNIKEVLGLVKGNTVRARWFGRDIAAGLKNLVGGEIKSYTEMMDKARDSAIQAMEKQAKDLGADAVVCIRITTADVMQGSAEIVAYGTAVKLKK
ncbi:heavy metal-binding domain-containing protein [Candidatus Woesearchaeota archaeon]|nr:heavy metal-binding domain-containing protein [Candidatus Woesearchaeota archaeon]